MHSFTRILVLVAALVACIFTVHASPIEERSVAMSMTPQPIDEAALARSKKPTPKGVHCALKKKGNCKASNAYIVANLIQHQNGTTTQNGHQGYRVYTHNDAAVYLTIVPYGKATISFKNIGKYATKGINNCKKNGLTHADVYVDSKDYQAHGFHKTDNSVFITVAHKPYTSSK